MVRVNLLPSEILERRKYERFYFPIIAIGIILLLVVLGGAGALRMYVVSCQETLQGIEQDTANTKRQADALAIFEQQQATLEAREQVVTRALKDRIAMGILMEELSYILPDKAWVTDLQLHQDDGLTLRGYTPESSKNNLDDSYKALAAVLVRINSLKGLKDVWLSRASSASFSNFQGASSSGSVQVIEFTVNGKLIKKSEMPVSDEASASPVPAPVPAPGN
ncbi:MAG: hypothetical protein FWE94_02930 [Coriobacteriia bacterium]|nr:hypothetical protein [Coriobacteriia bacterium]